VDWKAAFSTVG